MPTALSALVLTLALAACDGAAPDRAASGTPGFGMDYALAADTAVLDGDTLRATVSYSGGCKAHAFRVASRQDEGGVEIWLVHEGEPDSCEAYLTDTLAVATDVPTDAAPVVLLAPDGGSVRLR